ncbi:hypothetical protein GCM10010178_24820 [Lentzea flava]|uniref:Uncharacterized protein n=1 Tax=Lentzea flava TaxID=103732 RepID=A0ABQ2UGI7_9PSEU|nr:hypothetical protein GCM10010178_24820 [Lentzea flava]
MPRRARELDGRAEQRVADRAEARAAHVAGLGLRPRPEPLPLERVRRQVRPDSPGTFEQPRPVNGHTGDVQARQRRHERELLAAVLAGGGHRAVDHRGQHAVRADLHERLVAHRDHRVVEAHGFADVLHPVLGLLNDPTSQQRDRRIVERNTGDGRAELVQHRFHQRRVEGVGNVELPDLPVVELFNDPTSLLFHTGDDDRARAVDGGDGDAVGEVRKDLVLGGLQGDHDAARRERLHQRRARRHQRAGVFEGQHTGDVRGRDLADRMARHLLRHQSERLQQPEHRHLEGEQRGLRVAGLVQQGGVVAPHHRTQRRVEMREDLVESGSEHREPGVELAAHPDPL